MTCNRHQWLPSATRAFMLEFLKSCAFPQKCLSFLLASLVKLQEILVELKYSTLHTTLSKNAAKNMAEKNKHF